MLNQVKKTGHVSQVIMAWLLSSIGLTVAPHLLRLPLIISVIFIAVFILSLLTHLKKLPIPNKPIRFALTIIVVLIVFLPTAH